MTDLENVKGVISGLREGIANGTTDLDAVASGLNRVENLLGGNGNGEPRRPFRERNGVADKFWNDKARKEGWAKK